jgi:peptide chain release factor 3
MKAEFNVEVVVDNLPYTIARRTDAESAGELGRQRGVEVFQRTDGELLALFGDKWRLQYITKEMEHLTIEPLVADTN